MRLRQDILGRIVKLKNNNNNKNTILTKKIKTDDLLINYSFNQENILVHKTLTKFQLVKKNGVSIFKSFNNGCTINDSSIINHILHPNNNTNTNNTKENPWKMVFKNRFIVNWFLNRLTLTPDSMSLIVTQFVCVILSKLYAFSHKIKIIHLSTYTLSNNKTIICYFIVIIE